MEFPEPVIELAIEPKTKAGQGKMGEALAKLAEEDPTFRAHTNQETGQTIIAGMGELHLEIIVDRLLREFHVEANVGAPQVAYKEAFTKAVEVDSKYAKQSGGRGQYGHCKVKFEPLEANCEKFDFDPKANILINDPPTLLFESTVVGGSIPKEYIPAVGEGIQEAAQAGIWVDSLYWVFMRMYMMDPIMRSTPPRWHSTLQVPWHSRKQCRRQLLYCLSRS